MKHKVLIVSHGHPDFSKGGAEIAAHALFGELSRHADWDAWLLAGHGMAALKHTGTAFSARPVPREILFAGGTDYFTFSANDLTHLVRDFSDLLERIRPDVVHFHHYAVVGIEMIRVVRNVLPEARVFLTLHEFLAICNHNGQMIKTNGALCRRANPGECHACMPGRSAQDFFLRELYIKSFLALVDRFIAPSAFLKQRYVEWGLDASRVTVLENGQPAGSTVPPRPLREGELRNHFGYFGQITPYKGLELLLQAFALLPKAIKKQAHLEVFGGGQHMFDRTFQDRIEVLLRDAHQNVQYCGPYAPEDLPRLMSRVDWVVVPSIWWENSPLVIQEALKHRRPIICGDIGGMAEKVQHGVTGLHFRAGSAAALAEVIEETVLRPETWGPLHAGITEPLGLSDMAATLTGLYLGRRDTTAHAA